MNRFGLVLGIFFILGGCNQLERPEIHDPSLNLKKTDFQELAPPTVPVPLPIRQRPLGEVPAKGTMIPASMKVPVTINVGEEVPLKDVLLEIAKQAKVNVSVDPKIQGHTVLHTHKKPMIEIIQQLARVHNLRYQIHGDMLSLEADEPYLTNYDVQFLSLTRKHQNRVSIATDIFSNTVAQKAQIDNGSNTVVTDSTTNDFWQELELNLKSILKNSSPFEKGAGGDVDFSVHKQGGIVSVFGTSRQHEIIQEYLTKLKKAVSSQVLIEAKIMEVSLTDDHKTGINWNQIKGDVNLLAPLGSLGKPGAYNPGTQASQDVVSFAVKGDRFSAVSSFMEKFGTVRTLSNPRLTVMNNHSAVLKVATNKVFFRIQYDKQTGMNDKADVYTTSSQVQTVPIGLVMVVHPSINSDTGEITMTVRPTISSTQNSIPDPAAAAIMSTTGSSVSAKNEVPEVQVREMDSILRMTSGDTMIMGGLMEEGSNNTASGLPGTSEIPFMNWLLGSKEDTRTVRELVIFLKATILEDSQRDSIVPADKELYQKFSKDPRPLAL